MTRADPLCFTRRFVFLMHGHKYVECKYLSRVCKHKSPVVQPMTLISVSAQITSKTPKIYTNNKKSVIKPFWGWCVTNALTICYNIFWLCCVMPMCHFKTDFGSGMAHGTKLRTSEKPIFFCVFVFMHKNMAGHNTTPVWPQRNTQSRWNNYWVK